MARKKKKGNEFRVGLETVPYTDDDRDDALGQAMRLCDRQARTSRQRVDIIDSADGSVVDSVSFARGA